MNTKLQFNLNISASEILRFYNGSARNLRVTLASGQNIQLPLSNFRPFVNENGLHGHFEVEFTEQFKLVELVKLI